LNCNLKGILPSRNVNGQTFTLNYDAENRLVSVSGNATANFSYDGDGKQIKATVNGTTTVYVGNHYEVKNSIVTKYYFAGATRIAVRTNGMLSYLLGDHLGSSSVTTDANGVKTASALYKAFGETRYTLGNLGTDYKFTGQREEAALGIYFFNARWMDPSLGRFTQPDTIVPTSTQGTQAWDRYAYVNNNPVKYFDRTGHDAQIATIGPEEVVILAIIVVAIVVAIDGRRRHGVEGYCTDSLATCFEKNQMKKFSDHQKIDSGEFNDMLDAISDDLDSRPRTAFDLARADYDTPFFNGDNRFENDSVTDSVVCIGDKCSKQSAVNYVAQGMYSARTGQSIDGANGLANLWNSLYGHPASEDELYWLQHGYCYYYSTHNEDGSELPEVCTSQ
jgi:RHS repeat-associated protein